LRLYAYKDLEVSINKVEVLRLELAMCIVVKYDVSGGAVLSRALTMAEDLIWEVSKGSSNFLLVRKMADVPRNLLR